MSLHKTINYTPGMPLSWHDLNISSVLTKTHNNNNSNNNWYGTITGATAGGAAAPAPTPSIPSLSITTTLSYEAINVNPKHQKSVLHPVSDDKKNVAMFDSQSDNNQFLSSTYSLFDQESKTLLFTESNSRLPPPPLPSAATSAQQYTLLPTKITFGKSEVPFLSNSKISLLNSNSKSSFNSNGNNNIKKINYFQFQQKKKAEHEDTINKLIKLNKKLPKRANTIERNISTTATAHTDTQNSKKPNNRINHFFPKLDAKQTINTNDKDDDNVIVNNTTHDGNDSPSLYLKVKEKSTIFIDLDKIIGNVGDNEAERNDELLYEDSTKLIQNTASGVDENEKKNAGLVVLKNTIYNGHHTTSTNNLNDRSFSQSSISLLNSNSANNLFASSSMGFQRQSQQNLTSKEMRYYERKFLSKYTNYLKDKKNHEKNEQEQQQQQQQTTNKSTNDPRENKFKAPSLHNMNGPDFSKLSFSENEYSYASFDNLNKFGLSKKKVHFIH